MYTNCTKQELKFKIQQIRNILLVELSGSTTDLVDELFTAQGIEDELYRSNLMNDLSLNLSGSQMDLVDDLLEIDSHLNPIK